MFVTKEERTKLVFSVKIQIPNPEGILKPGMPAGCPPDNRQGCPAMSAAPAAEVRVSSKSFGEFKAVDNDILREPGRNVCVGRTRWFREDNDHQNASVDFLYPNLRIGFYHGP
jgi:hypothetical protein